MEGVEEQEAGRVILDLCTAIEVLTDVGDESPDSEAKRAWRNGCRWMAGAPLEEAPKARPRAPEAASAEGSQPGAVKESLTTGSQEEPPAGPPKRWYLQVLAGSNPPAFSVRDAEGNDYPKNQGAIDEATPPWAEYKRAPVPDLNHVYWLVWAARHMVVACSGRDAESGPILDQAKGLGYLLAKYFANIPDVVGSKAIGAPAAPQEGDTNQGEKA
jgi:hypothetical protein